MYRPRAYVEDDVRVLHEIIRTRSFATLAATIDGEVQFAYAPVALDSHPPRGGVRFHLARANPMSRLDGAGIRLSFLGPDAYVSPDWYVTEGLVPTWNYVAVEASGTARQLKRAELLALLADLSAQEEERLRPKKPWTPEKVPSEKLEPLLDAIVGFSVRFDTLEGKLKLSQDKAAGDFEGAARALEASDDSGDRAVASAMRRYRRPHP